MIESVPMGWRLKRQKYNLIGTQCTVCSKKFFPPRSFCPTCRRKGQIQEFQFSGHGKIESFTVIRVAPSGFEAYAPYAMGIIALKEGAKVPGIIVSDLEKVDLDKPVRPVFRRVTEDGKEGVINYGIKFEVVE